MEGLFFFPSFRFAKMLAGSTSPPDPFRGAVQSGFFLSRAFPRLRGDLLFPTNAGQYLNAAVPFGPGVHLTRADRSPFTRQLT